MIFFISKQDEVSDFMIKNDNKKLYSSSINTKIPSMIQNKA